ncbi:PAS domain-containing protein [Niveispirillum sp. BGYR6]|uniref:PAS domain-containing protein n=1 Tax=Niveispirillum sp. BGYR6 TaxID=2971249 RepID=UPI0022B99A0B|nr:PAS domain-containing protein [Niveispirillum sp. BGYR6]MDG5494620.1 PAS domain-containing protein [Niveispirillum sp. BGYR6]
MSEASNQRPPLTGRERQFSDDELIVTKTDKGGRITYANRTFLRVAHMTEAEALGTPHNCIRHPDMPRVVFKLLWDQIGAGKEIFAYVLNRARNGDHYWVFAHVTPSRDMGGNIIGYHSNRRTADRRIVSEIITPVYKALLDEEAKHSRIREGMAASEALLGKVLRERGQSYDQFIFSL